MPVAAYYAWDRLGRPLTPAQPIREFVDKMKVAFPAAAAQNQFGWYADESHYTAVPAEDHAPFSQTGWPGVSPQWYVFATDVVHRPDLGVDISVLGAYWLAEARGGRMPWLKYMNWAGHYYDVRNNWQQQSSSDDPGHIHLSARTDYVNSGLGAWSPVPGAAPTAKETEMIGIRDPEGGEFTVGMSPASPTGYYYTPVVDGVRSTALQAGGVIMVSNGTRPGAFGPSGAEVRTAIIHDVAAAVVAALPPDAGGGTPLTVEQVAAAVRFELDRTGLSKIG